jgi:hypothetical protein
LTTTSSIVRSTNSWSRLVVPNTSAKRAKSGFESSRAATIVAANPRSADP